MILKIVDDMDMFGDIGDNGQFVWGVCMKSEDLDPPDCLSSVSTII